MRMSFRRCKNVVELVISTLCCTAAASALAYMLLLESLKHMIRVANLHIDLLRGRMGVYLPESAAGNVELVSEDHDTC